MRDDEYRRMVWSSNSRSTANLLDHHEMPEKLTGVLRDFLDSILYDRLNDWAGRFDPESRRAAYIETMIGDLLCITSFDEDDENTKVESKPRSDLKSKADLLIEIGRSNEVEVRYEFYRLESEGYRYPTRIDEEPEYGEVRADAYHAILTLSAHPQTPELFIIAKAFKEQEALEAKQEQSERDPEDRKD
jgi:hypothetical protein